MKDLVTLLLLLLCFSSIAQKPLIDSTTFNKWPCIQPYSIQISNDGKYSSYFVVDKFKKLSHLTIISNTGGWKFQLSDSSFGNVEFSNNSNFFFFIKSNDSLGVITLGNNQVRYVSGVSNFQIIGNGKNEYLTYLKNSSLKEMVAENLMSKKKMVLNKVRNYYANVDGQTILLEKVDNINVLRQSLEWLNLQSGKSSTIWHGTNAHHYVFDSHFNQVAFAASDSNNKSKQILYYFKRGMKAPISFFDNDSTNFADNKNFFFNKSGDKIMFQLIQNVNNNLPSLKTFQTNLNIWHYGEERIQSEQLQPNALDRTTTSSWHVLNISNKKILKLTEPNEDLIHPENVDNYVLAVSKSSSTAYYKNENKPSLTLISIQNGDRDTIYRKKSAAVSGISPDERFVIFFDIDSLRYYSFDINAKTKRDLSGLVPVPLYDEEAIKMQRRTAYFEMGGWVTKDHSLLLYDKYDIWKVDPSAIKRSINITNSYGKSHHIEFRILGDHWFSDLFVRSANEKLFLFGYDREKKLNGFWETAQNYRNNPTKKIMGPYCYYIPRYSTTGYIESANGFVPIKAKDKCRYLIQRMTAEHFPNLFITDDFKSFRQISDIHPEKDYNWVTTELVNWKMNDEKMSQGILYKPENFDSAKKYPLIFLYYEQRSDQLYQYWEPEFSGDEINIPYYVSNGYLVFVPDIHYLPGHDGQEAVNAVISAAKYLSSFSWVDSTKLGLQGHSFGGWETNFLITHSNIFKAACTASGISDLVSAYDQLGYGGRNSQSYYEIGSQGSHLGVGVTPWTNTQTYLENSPILYVGNVTTPLLIEHGEADGSVPFPQAIEMFLALRRAGKKVWLLDYEKAYHSLFGDDAKDFTIRMKQFFDYYLKGSPPPVWMTRGVPAAKKGIESGLELDTSGAIP